MIIYLITIIQFGIYIGRYLIYYYLKIFKINLKLIQHTLTPGKYYYKLHIQNEIVNYFYNKYKK